MRLPASTVVLLLASALLGALPSAAAAQTQTGGASAQNSYDGYGGDQYYDDGSDEYSEDPQYDDGGYSEDDYGGGTYGDGNYNPPPKRPAKPAQPAEPSEPSEPSEPAPPATPSVPRAPSRYVAGRTAILQSNGRAAIPRGAPKAVRQLIAAGNKLIGKPYKWGGGHAKLEDKGYDCSGAVSYALIGGGLLQSPMVSGGLARWGSTGAGQWVTVYANKGHVYMEVAGLRLDTSPIGDASMNKGPRWRPLIGARKGFKVRHPDGL